MTYGDYPDLSKVQKILIIKLRHLGDVLLTAPVFASLKRALPKAEIDAYIYEEAKPMLEGHPAISELIGYDRKWKKRGFFQRLFREGRLLRKIRKRGYDCVINLTEGDRGAIAAKVSGARIRVGFVPKGGWQKKIYTHLVKHTPGLKHTVERNLDAVRRVGIFPEPEQRELYFQVPQEKRKESFVLIHPTSRWRFKCWPMGKMRELVQWLLSREKRVVLTSGPDAVEREMVAQVAKGLKVENLAGKLSLKELGALIQSAELLVCVDSVAFHMANALKRPVVAIFGPTSEVTWGPWRNPRAKIVAQNVSCRPCYQDGCGGSKHSDCLNTLSVKAIQEAILELEVLAEVGATGIGVRDELIDCARK